MATIPSDPRKKAASAVVAPRAVPTRIAITHSYHSNHQTDLLPSSSDFNPSALSAACFPPLLLLYIAGAAGSASIGALRLLHKFFYCIYTHNKITVFLQ